jgi:predicted tellurium resistance membrane protein TerC
MEAYLNTNTLLALITLTGMEIILGIDNIIFIAIIAGKLPKNSQDRARKLGISLALISRLALLLSITFVMGLTHPLFEVMGKSFSGRDLVLIIGGLFLIAKATYEIHDKLESGAEEHHVLIAGTSSFKSTILQIVILDIIFSLDSVITAVGMAREVWVMVTAMVISVIVMLLASNAISEFVHKHPTIKMLALSFLILIGVTLAVEGMGGHIGKGYIYFAMAFSLAVELLNIRFSKVQKPVKIHLPEQKK